MQMWTRLRNSRRTEIVDGFRLRLRKNCHWLCNHAYFGNVVLLCILVSRDGNFWAVVIVKSCGNKQAGSWLAAQELTANQKPGQQVDQTLDTMTQTHKFPVQDGFQDQVSEESEPSGSECSTEELDE